MLGYLPLLIRGHFQAIEILEEANKNPTGELASRLAIQMRELPDRGPEIVSCVFQVESLLSDKLGIQPPAPPRTMEECLTFSRGVATAFESSLMGVADERLTAYELGVQCGVAEALLSNAIRVWKLWTVAPENEALQARANAIRESFRGAVEAPGGKIECPTMQSEVTSILRDLGAASEIAARPPEDGSAEELSKIQTKLGWSARALEAAACGTPRTSIRRWFDKRLSGGELMRRLIEHRRWTVPARLEQDGKPLPRIDTFDKRVLTMYSDSKALAERPAFMKKDKPEEDLCLTLPGTVMFHWIPDAKVDVLVLDPTDDPNTTIHYPREMHSLLRQIADEIALEDVACDWSHLDPAPLKAYSFWILVDGSRVKSLLAQDWRGRPFVGLFNSEAALQAHLKLATPEQARDYARCLRYLLPGQQLFPSLAQLDVAGIILNPSGPGRTRTFNKRTLENLATGKNGV